MTDTYTPVLPIGFFGGAKPNPPAPADRALRAEVLADLLIEHQRQQIMEGTLRDPGGWLDGKAPV